MDTGKPVPEDTGGDLAGKNGAETEIEKNR